MIIEIYTVIKHSSSSPSLILNFLVIIYYDLAGGTVPGADEVGAALDFRDRGVA